MTKINKLGKSTFVIAILSFLLVAVLAFGGTYAYFSATAKVTDTSIQMGHIHLSDAKVTDGTVKVTQGTFAVPNQTIMSGKAQVSVDSNVNYFVRATITTKVTPVAAHDGLDEEGAVKNDECNCADKGVDVLDVTIAGTDWEAATGSNDASTVIYLTKAQAGAASPQVEELNITVKVNPEVGQVGSVHFMDATILVTITFEAIQADYIVGEGDAAANTTTPYEVSELAAAWGEALAELSND